ncbi:DUF6665 family protein [Labrys sp. ZIDIC5]|uniref:DUF6665 family protein n=1 Tax=Labrys sedimenti TaxID=3106036 RepID=UPI002ACA3DE2|nr:DUF6665 family protein [Labrys sp. ZIDIC5]MDZ5449664.1 DUF6665 family protein [Labrys sp. ZIDIC5]
MSVRLPQNFSPATARSALDVLGAEIRVEKAASLERAGEAAGQAMAALHAAATEDPARSRLLADAVDAVYGYFIQRELMGMASHGGVIRELRIPPEVLVRLGVRR